MERVDLSVERVRRLARSSPWRWHTLRFVTRWSGFPDGGPGSRAGVRAWVRRPGLLRVEALDGRVLMARREERSQAVAMLFATGGAGRGRALPPLPRATDVTPVYDADGLVEVRPDGVDADDPMYQSYDWVAMLDPVELAEGVALDEVREVGHHGRVAWEALARPGPGYDPRCSCCPLLLCEESERLEAEGGGPTMREAEPDLVFAEAHRVRLDVATGVCVLTEEIGGSHAGRGHEVEIEAVDEPMADELFQNPRRGPLARLRRDR